MTMTYRIHQNLYTYLHWKIRKYNTEADCHMSGQCLLDARKIDTGTESPDSTCLELAIACQSKYDNQTD